MPNPIKMYALLIGIDSYQLPVSPLYAAVADTDQMQSFLESFPNAKLDLKKLTNQDATRKAVIQAILSHLGQAKDGDTALLYFAGHGGREWAHEVFADYSNDGRLEGILLWDSISKAQPGKGMLVDKELRYLLRQVAAGGAHLVTIFDCCHSGQNTRSQLRSRQFPAPGSVDDTLPARDWKDFYFSNKLAATDLKAASMDEDFPEGNHLQLAACLASERANEDQNAGVFTAHLINILEQSGYRLSYQQLISRLRAKLRSEYQQTPVLYAADQHNRLAHTSFLRGAQLTNSFGRAPMFYQENKGWIVDLGQQQGLEKSTANFPIWNLDGDIYRGEVEEVLADKAVIKVDAKLSPDELYFADLTSLLSQSLHIYLVPENLDKTTVTSLKKELFPITSIQWVDDPTDAHYSLHFDQKEAKICRPNENQAIIRPIPMGQPNQLNHIAHNFQHIGRWHRLLGLRTRRKSERMINMAIFQHDSEGKNTEQKPIQQGKIHLHYNQKFREEPSGKIDIKLSNTSKRNRHLALIYFDPHFMVYPKLIPEGVIELPPGRDHWIRNLRLTIEPEVKAYNWQASISHLKVISADEHFDVQAYALDPLPGPFEPATRAGRAGLSKKEAKLRNEWEIWSVEMQMIL